MIARPSPSLSLDRDPENPHSTSTLALHLDCTRTYIGKLEAEGVIQRQGPSRSTRTALPTCDTCGASVNDHRA